MTVKWRALRARLHRRRTGVDRADHGTAVPCGQQSADRRGPRDPAGRL